MSPIDSDSKIPLTGGLSTKDAIHRLYRDIEDYLDLSEVQLNDIQSFKYILRQAYSSKSVYSTFRLTSVVFLFISIITYLLSSKYGHFTSSIPLTIESIILILVLIINTGIIYWNTRSRYLEMFSKARLLSAKIKECSKNEELIQQWMSGNFYPQLNTPTSPCITLQWTYRDGRLVNLPTSLLVNGDVVLLNPGRQVPANCRRIEKVIKKEKTLSDFNFDSENKNGTTDDDLNHPYNYIFYGNDSMKDCTLMRGDTFVPTVDNVPEIFTIPRLRKAVKPCMFLVVETPYIGDLKIALSNYSNRRSATAFEKELRLIFVRYLEHILVPFICILVFIFSIIHYCYIEFTGTHFDTGPATIVLIFLRPIMAILPLLPLALPILWLVLNVYGLIKIYMSYEIFSENETVFKTISNSRTSSKSNFRKPNQYSSSEDLDNNVLNWPNSAEQGNMQNKEFFLEEMDPEKLNFTVYKQKMTLKRIFIEFYLFLTNANGILWRTTNLLHVLGSITALSCVDKKGIISWPNPTADKVFFLTAPGDNRRKSHQSNQTAINENVLDESADLDYFGQAEVDKRNSVLSCNARAECVQLDITHDRQIAYGLQFDDVYWDRYMSNLKPLGLAILLNTCNQATQEEFVKFSDHIACESLHNEVAVPVVNKRCLCELARQIGFKENAIRGYEYRYQVALFRHIRAELIQRGKLAKSLNFPRLKMPFPNMTCAVIKDVFSNTSQLFSQGTGDLILDACAEYWNGENLVVLNDYERKKILDFYQRSSLTSYCCAFSYLPLINESGGIHNQSTSDSNYLSDYYIELPPDSSHLFPSQRSLDASLRGLAIDSHYFHNTSQNETYSNSRSISRHLSSDSLRKFESSNSGDTNELVGGDKPKEANNSSSDNQKDGSKHVGSDSQNLEQTMKKVVNQVFIGMATLQYQACSDFVRLIELLEAACIRFVHFSKENELRSRVFSEKMGLESGWNCHISLLNDIEPSNSNENFDLKKSKSNLNENSVKFNKSSYHNSLSSLSSTGSLLENNKEHDSDNEDWDERIESFPGKDEIVKFNRRKKHNSFSVSSDRSESMASNLRYNRPREYRSSSKVSSHSNAQQRNMSPSPSRLTTASTMTEHSAPIGFDMSNRAKLPKGIDNIRPHLENVDNVPLLVSLFTDCTSEATKEMIKIMQEYEEVVCVIGSMANDGNIAIFLQADASIGIEPMYPHYCITEPICPSDYLPTLDLHPNFISPTDLANQLISLPCSLTMPRQNSIIFYQLIMNSRDYMMRMRNIFQFYLSSCLSLSLAQMVTSLLFLPPLLSPGIVIWLSLIVIPLLSVSLMGTQRDQNVMNVATGKKLHLNKETIVYFFIGYIIKFIPSIIISVILFAIIIGMSCGQTNVGRATLGPCWMFSDVKANGDIKNDLIWSSYLLIGQTIASFFFVLYLIIISIGFVHRNHLLWQRSPLTNICWLSTSILLLVMHIGVCLVEIYIYVPEAQIAKHFIEIIPFYIWIIGFMWPILLIAANVFTKRHEISMSSRQQRRARLEFGTKLGMNSPF